MGRSRRLRGKWLRLCDLAGFNFFNEVDLVEIIDDVVVGQIDKLVS